MIGVRADQLPSTDLYFLNACGDWVRRWFRRGPVRRLGANSFTCGDTMLVVRRDSQPLLRRALDWPGQLIYLIDDDIAAAVACPHLPRAYRRRLAEFDRSWHRPLLVRADALVTPAAALVARFGADPAITGAVHRIDPYWPDRPADQGHFAPLAAGGTLQVVHLGSGSHRAALGALAPIMAGLLAGHDDLAFTYFAAHAVDDALEAHPRARRIEPKPWPEYRRWLGRNRFHLGLYPLMDTPFDRARSVNKLIEHAIVGAVGLYPHDWDGAALQPGGVLTAPPAPAQWGDALAQALASRATLAERAARANAAWPALNNWRQQRRLWAGLLGLPGA